jgi:hypothetical protein
MTIYFLLFFLLEFMLRASCFPKLYKPFLATKIPTLLEPPDETSVVPFVLVRMRDVKENKVYTPFLFLEIVLN